VKFFLDFYRGGKAEEDNQKKKKYVLGTRKRDSEPKRRDSSTTALTKRDQKKRFIASYSYSSQSFNVMYFAYSAVPTLAEGFLFVSGYCFVCVVCVLCFFFV
jgi:hypothetical protein